MSTFSRGGHFTADGPNEFFCPECGRRCTRSPDGAREYGHRSKPEGRGEQKTCPRRESKIDHARRPDYQHQERDELGRFV